MAEEEKTLTLPINATSRSDVSRLLREVDGLEEFLRQAAIRTPGTALQLPKTSRLFDELTNANQLNMLREEDRNRLRTFLTVVRAKAPVLHMSFSADPSPLFMQKLVQYLRSEIHPLVLVSTGLQPHIGAGCIVRSTNKIFDFSLRKHFTEKRSLLIEKLHADLQTEQNSATGAQP